ncbi:hypothetical protein INT45_006526 [Circinella minor]|uniref:Tc1-like transposase DDE domain-containing protein n=1 Tax=Circinella minor TaxID=1195481 RepID=A0A8H7RRF1_9FUNG|nr:hypothetical protein INT45_006526 [Circinella minor]
MVEPEIVIVQEEDINEDPQNYYFEFPVDPARLAQDRDYIDSSTDDDTDDDDETILSSDDEGLVLRSIVPVPPISDVKSTISSIAKTKRDDRVTKKSRRKYNNQASKKQRSLELRAYGWSFAKIAKVLDMPESTVKLHYSRYENRNGNAAPIKKKSYGCNKITSDGSKFLEEMILKQNTLTLEQIRHAYFLQYQVLLNPSTIYRHLVNKCGVTIKRAYPYAERRTDDATKDMRKGFVEEYIQSGIAKYGNNCVFIDEASVCASLCRNNAWAPAGEVAHVKLPQLRTQSKTVLGAICHTGIVELCVKTNKGGTKTRDFYAFLGLVMDKLDERSLAHQGWNLIYDNAPIHKAAYIGEMVKEQGDNFIFLPHYSPFLNPIKEFFSKMKTLFRQIDYHPTEQNEVEMETGVEEEEVEEEEDNVDDMERRFTTAISKVTTNNFETWINHSKTFFDRCVA